MQHTGVEEGGGADAKLSGGLRPVGPLARFESAFGRLSPKYDESHGPQLRVTVHLGGGVAADAAAGRGTNSELASQAVSLAAQSGAGSAALPAAVLDALQQARRSMWRAWDREAGRAARRKNGRANSSMSRFQSGLEMVAVGSSEGGVGGTSTFKDLVDPCERDCEIEAEPAFACAGCNRSFGLRRDWRRHVSSGTCTQPSDFGVVEEPYRYGDGSQTPPLGWRRMLRSGGVDLGVGPVGLRIIRQAAALAHAAAGGGAAQFGGNGRAAGRSAKAQDDAAHAAEAADTSAAAGGLGQWSLLSPCVLSVFLNRWGGEPYLTRAARRLVLTGRVAVPVPPGGDIDRSKLVRKFERWWKKNGPVHPAGVAAKLRRRSQFTVGGAADQGMQLAHAAASDALKAFAAGAKQLPPREPTDPLSIDGLEPEKRSGLVKVMPRQTNRPWLVQTHPAASPVVPTPASFGGPWLLPHMAESDRALFRPGVLAMHLERQLR